MKDAKGHGSDPRSGGGAAHQSGVNEVAPTKVAVHPNVADIIKRNPNGFSVDPRTGRQPTSGYMVAVPGRTQLLNAGELSEHHVDRFAQTHADVFQNPNMHIGGWEHEGKVYLDPSENIPGRAAAIAAGRERNQIAIWDVKRQRAIPTGGSGT